MHKLLHLAGALMLVAATPAHGTWRFPTENLDRSVSPAIDFYDFATGGWRKAHPIPPEYSRWNVFSVVEEHTQQRLRTILEQAASAQAPRGSDLQRVGDFYASGMDEAAIEAARATPIRPEIDRIASIGGADALEEGMAHLHDLAVDAGFSFGQMPDPGQSSRTIGVADEGGMALPDRSYYLEDDARSRTVRAAYVLHVQKMLELLGEPTPQATADAGAVLKIETALAKASLTRVERRDPHATYHLTNLAALGALTPHFSWPRYFALRGHPEIQEINVTSPAFFAELDRQLSSASLDDWKGYLRWQLLNGVGPYLSSDFVNEEFHFGAVLTGAERLRPRWLRVLTAEDRALGFAVGKLYVEQNFPPEAKAQAAALVDRIQAALRRDLQTLPWMTAATRAEATEKLDRMVNKIGYPERWRDYTGLDIDRGPFVLNALRASAFEVRRALDKIGKPTDRGEWDMTPQTVNAYYEPSLNEIVFPAGILQPPFFDPEAPAAWNYGGIGVVIGHEITHGFDDEGSQYDALGNLRNWWTPEDAARFHERTRCIADQFSRFTVAGGVHVNGPLVTGEATADLGGVRLSFFAYADAVREGLPGTGVVEGFTPQQLFFLSFAGVWASNVRPEEQQLLALTDPHPPERYRVIGTLSNVQEFQDAFAVPPGSPMVNPNRCEIW